MWSLVGNQDKFVQEFTILRYLSTGGPHHQKSPCESNVSVWIAPLSPKKHLQITKRISYEPQIRKYHYVICALHINCIFSSVSV